MTQTGRIVSINISERTGTKKAPVTHGELKRDHGIVDDAHAGPHHRQVSLLAQESIDKMRAKGADVSPGSFGENLTVEGIDLVTLPIGTTLVTGGGTILEVTQIGKVCHDRCAIYYSVGDCVMPREGIFVRVIEGGDIRPGDTITVKTKGGPE